MKGSTVKKGNRWYAVYEGGKDENGKRKKKWEGGFDTKREAQRVLRTRIDEIESSFVRSGDSSTVAVYLRHWLSSYCKQRLAANTINGYRANVEKHIIPNIGDIPLNCLDSGTIQALYLRLEQQGLSRTTVRYVHNTLHKALGTAVKHQVLARNAADCVDVPTVARFEAQTLNPGQLRTLIMAAKETEIHMPILFSALLGLRRGETLALRWEDADFHRNTISVKHSADYIGGKLVFHDTKTKNSRRTLQMPEYVSAALQQQKQAQDRMRALYGDAYNPDDLICCRSDGTPLTTNMLQHQYKQLLSSAGLPDIRFHDLRHSYATLMLRNDIPAKIVSSMLGHSNISITLDTYSHVITEMQQPAICVVDKIFDDL